MNHSHCHPTLAEANSLIADLAKISPFKLSRYKELHAKALGFNSFNGLADMLKQKPVYFDLNVFWDSFTMLSKEKYGVDIEENEDAAEGMSALLFNSRDAVTDSVKVSIRVARFDFQLLSHPSEKFNPRPLVPMPYELPHADLARFANHRSFEPELYMEINEFLKSVQVSGKPVDTFLWGSVPKTIQNNNHESDIMFYEGLECSGFRIYKTNFLKEGSLAFFTTSNGENVSADEGKDAVALSTGFGSLFFIVDDETEFKLKEEDYKKIVNLSQEVNVSEGHKEIAFSTVPSVAFVGEPTVTEYEILPTKRNGHICHTYLEEEIRYYSPFDYIPALGTDEACEKYVGKTYYDGVFCIPVDEYGCVPSELVYFWHHGLHVEVYRYSESVIVRRPSASVAYTVMGWDVAQCIHKLHNKFRKAYKDNPAYAEFEVMDTIANHATEGHVVNFSETLFVEVLDINMEKANTDDVSFELMHEIDGMPSVQYSDHLSMMETKEQFADLLLEMGVTSFLYNELQEHSAGQNVANINVGYNEEGDELIVWETHTGDGWTKEYDEFNTYLRSRMSDQDSGLRREMEHSRVVLHYLPSEWWGGAGYISLAKPFDHGF